MSKKRKDFIAFMETLLDRGIQVESAMEMIADKHAEIISKLEDKCITAELENGRMFNALRELVHLKDLKELIEGIEDEGEQHDNYSRMRLKYKDNKPKAWKQARAVLLDRQQRIEREYDDVQN